MNDEEKRSNNRERVKRPREVKKNVKETSKRRSRYSRRQCEEQSSNPSEVEDHDAIIGYPQQDICLEIGFPVIKNEQALDDIEIQPSVLNNSDADIENGDEHMEDLKLVLKEIRKLAYESRQQTIAIRELQQKLDKAISAGTIGSRNETFERKYSIDLPFTTVDDFTAFDNRISEDEELRKALLTTLARKWDEKKTISKNIAAILRKYLTREVAGQFNAQKSIAGKMLFKTTAFSRVLLGVIDNLIENRAIPNVTESEYLVQLGAVLSNVKDWGVPRHSRRPKVQNNVE